MGKKTKVTKQAKELALRYCKDQLANMDGSYEAGIRRIGMERFNKFVEEIAKNLSVLAEP